jgi:hypothetical protein
MYSRDAEPLQLNRVIMTNENVQKWSTSLGVPRSVLYDQLAMYLARGFHASELPFSFCDHVINDLHAVISRANENRPDLFWQVFLAFDAGEFYPNNNRDQDPVAIYTRPQITLIVQREASRQR